MNPWIEAFRLKTLPLAFSSVITGSMLAYNTSGFSWGIFGMALLTTLLLQVLSNLANDLGDFQKGTDDLDRLGPRRMVQQGLITEKQMKRAVAICAFLALISGLMLLYISFDNMREFLIFLAIGIAAITAAIMYTVGKKAYGYHGLGDIFVFIFFGLVGVFGSYFLQTKQLTILPFFPAIIIGMFSSAVLNINNIRDIKNDTLAGKRTLVVSLGLVGAQYYHALLILGAFALAIVHVVFFYTHYLQLMFLLVLPALLMNVRTIFTFSNPALLNNELKRVSLATFFFSVLFSIHVFWV